MDARRNRERDDAAEIEAAGEKDSADWLRDWCDDYERLRDEGTAKSKCKNTSIDIRKTRMVNGREISGLLCERFETLEDARSRIADLRDESNGGKYDDCTFEIVRICDDIDSQDYCKVVEVIDVM